MILVVKKSNVIQLHVDAASEHGVGPKLSRSNGGKETVYLGGVPGMTSECNQINIYNSCQVKFLKLNEPNLTLKNKQMRCDVQY